MKLQLAVQSFELPLKNPFTISRYTVTVQKTVLVSITDGNYIGYGDATVNPYYNSTVDSLKHSVASVKSIFTEIEEELHPTELWKLLEPKLKDNYFALCAIVHIGISTQNELKNHCVDSGVNTIKIYQKQIILSELIRLT